MSQSDDRQELHWLEDIVEAIEEIQSHPRFNEGKETLNTDKYYRVWVLYHMERIGECASRLRQNFHYDDKHPDIDWKGTQGMRRHLVHRYWGIDNDQVWQGVEYLPKIKEKVNRIIEEKQRKEG